jgi:chromosome segregation ATPase
MTKTTDALEDLVPFAEAVLLLRDASKELQQSRQQLAAVKADLSEATKQKDLAAERMAKALDNTRIALEQETAAKRGKEEALREREEILAKAKSDAQAAYDAQLVQKQASLQEVDRKIKRSNDQLLEIEAAIVDSQTRLEAVEKQIGTLRSQFA